MTRRIVYAQYGNSAAYPPLLHSARLLADAGWEVLVLGIADAATQTLTFPPHPRITHKKLPHVTPGWRRVLYFLYFCVWVLWQTVRWRAEWLYASDVFAAPGALAVSYLPNVRVVYHEHDAPQGGRGMVQWCVRARNVLARRAAVCVFPSIARAERFAHEAGGGVQTRVVMNCPARAEVLPLSALRREMFRVLYHGTLVPARLPLTVVEALAQLPDVCLRVVGYETVGHPNYMRTFLERARGLGVADRVEWKGAVPRSELLDVARECDAGLALLPPDSTDWNEQTMAGASNKPFDYLACGLALVVSDVSDLRALFVETGLARACDPRDAASIASAVGWYREHAAERASMRERAREKILTEWNYEIQFAPVQQLLERA